MAKPLSPIEGVLLYCRNDGRKRHRGGHVSGRWHKGQMARARRRHCRREVVEMLERDLVELGDA
jgi:hypothetical protein